MISKVAVVGRGSAIEFHIVRLWPDFLRSCAELLTNVDFAHPSKRIHSMDRSVLGSEDIALAPPSQLTSRASASTDHSLGTALNTGSSGFANSVPSIKPNWHATSAFHLTEMPSPPGLSGNQQATYPTELR